MADHNVEDAPGPAGDRPGPGFWLASNGQWYPPEKHPNFRRPGWWQASNGQWYPPEKHPDFPLPGWWQASNGQWYPPEKHPDFPLPGWWQASNGQWYPPSRAPTSPPRPQQPAGESALGWQPDQQGRPSDPGPTPPASGAISPETGHGPPETGHGPPETGHGPPETGHGPSVLFRPAPGETTTDPPSAAIDDQAAPPESAEVRHQQALGSLRAESHDRFATANGLTATDSRSPIDHRSPEPNTPEPNTPEPDAPRPPHQGNGSKPHDTKTQRSRAAAATEPARAPARPKTDDSFTERLREVVGDTTPVVAPPTQPQAVRLDAAQQPAPPAAAPQQTRPWLRTLLIVVVLVVVAVGAFAVYRQLSAATVNTSSVDQLPGPATSTPDPVELIAATEIDQQDEPANRGELYAGRPGATDQDRERSLGKPARVAGYTASIDQISRDAIGAVRVDVRVLNRSEDELPIDPFHWKLQSPGGRIDPPMLGGDDALRPERLATGTSRLGKLLFEVPAVAGGYYIIYEPDQVDGARAIWRHDMDPGEDASQLAPILAGESERDDDDANPGFVHPGRADERPGDVEIQSGDTARIAGYSTRIETVAIDESAGSTTDGRFLKVTVTIFNRRDTTRPYNVFDWKLEADGRGIEPLLVVSQPRIDRGELVSGGQLTGDIYFRFDPSSAGPAYLTYEPDPASDSRAVWELPAPA